MKYLLFLAAGLGIIGFVALKPQPVADILDSSPRLTLRVQDIGQGDSIYLRTPGGEDILVDTGPDDRVLPELGRSMSLGDRTIELLIITHDHADHIGGLDSVLARYEVKRIWITGAIHTTDQYLKMLRLIKEKGVPTTTIKAGALTKAGGVELLVLHPVAEMTGQLPADQHDATIVTKVSYKQFCTLLTGDLDETHEAIVLEVAKSLNQSLVCPVLKVTHHGSAHGSSNAFLEATKPKVAIISSGIENRYGHPATSALKRLQEIGATIYRTDLNGTVTVTTDGSQYWTKTER